MINTPKLHFINHLDYNNIGDWLASPLNYFADYFIERYNVVYHTLELVRWNEIAPNDAIILGGGGLFENTPDIQEWINRMLDACGCVIAWSVGFHRRGEEPVLPEIDYSKFALLTVRDYEHSAGLEYLPCVTCMLPQLRKKKENKQKLGVISHTEFSIIDSGLPVIDNSTGINEMTDFIAESDTILTSSFHAAYWAMLMGKKTIVAFVWADKFKYFKCKPVLLNELSVEIVNKVLADGEVKVYNDWLDECVDLNLKFFERVKKCLEEYIPQASKAETTVILLKQQESNNMTLHRRMNGMVEQVNTLVGQIEQRFELIEDEVIKLQKRKTNS
jgi:hypothetical protein